MAEKPSQSRDREDLDRLGDALAKNKNMVREMEIKSNALKLAAEAREADKTKNRRK